MILYSGMEMLIEVVAVKVTDILTCESIRLSSVREQAMLFMYVRVSLRLSLVLLGNRNDTVTSARLGLGCRVDKAGPTPTTSTDTSDNYHACI